VLDPSNPRIPELGVEPSQREIVFEPAEHDNVYELARHIADLGYFPTELLIAVEGARPTWGLCRNTKAPVISRGRDDTERGLRNTSRITLGAAKSSKI
jgi:hypothetical protein